MGEAEGLSNRTVITLLMVAIVLPLFIWFGYFLMTSVQEDMNYASTVAFDRFVSLSKQVHETGVSKQNYMNFGRVDKNNFRIIQYESEVEEVKPGCKVGKNCFCHYEVVGGKINSEPLLCDMVEFDVILEYKFELNDPVEMNCISPTKLSTCTKEGFELPNDFGKGVIFRTFNYAITPQKKGFWGSIGDKLKEKLDEKNNPNEDKKDSEDEKFDAIKITFY